MGLSPDQKGPASGARAAKSRGVRAEPEGQPGSGPVSQALHASHYPPPSRVRGHLGVATASDNPETQERLKREGDQGTEREGEGGGGKAGRAGRGDREKVWGGEAGSGSRGLATVGIPSREYPGPPGLR